MKLLKCIFILVKFLFQIRKKRPAIEWGTVCNKYYPPLFSPPVPIQVFALLLIVNYAQNVFYIWKPCECACICVCNDNSFTLSKTILKIKNMLWMTLKHTSCKQILLSRFMFFMIYTKLGQLSAIQAWISSNIKVCFS